MMDRPDPPRVIALNLHAMLGLVCRLPVAVLMSLALWTGSMAHASQLIKVRADEVDAIELMTQIAGLSGQRIVVGRQDGAPRISLTAEANDGQALIELIARRLGWPVEQRDSFLVVGHFCPVVTRRLGPEYRTLLSLSFADESVGGLLELIQDVLDPLNPKPLTGAATDRVSLMARNTKVFEFWGALTAEPGSPRAKVCEQRGSTGLRAMAPPVKTAPIDPDFCPYRPRHDGDPKRRRCQPLEAFGLHSLAFKGYLALNGQHDALIQKPDGGLYRASPGAVLGRNYGDLVTVTDRGVVIRELIQNEQDEWVERHHDIAYGERIAPGPWSRDRSYIHPGSPLQAYLHALERSAARAGSFPRMIDHCARLVPDVGPDLRHLLDRWREKNADVLHEVTRHLAALELDAIEDGVAAKDLPGKQRDPMLDIVIQPLDEAYCRSRRPWDQADKPFDPALLRTLRSCVDDGTCWRLIQSGDVETKASRVDP